MGGGGWKRVALGGKKERFVRKKCFWFAKKLAFSAHTRLSDKEKAFFSTPQQPLPTAPKLTSNCKFYPRQPTVSLQYNNSFSKNISLASAVQLPFRTDSKPFRRRFAGKTGFETSRRKTLQNYFRQSFESWVAGLRPVCFLVTFCTMQKVTTRSLCREYRGSANLDSAHRSDIFTPQQLKPF